MEKIFIIKIGGNILDDPDKEFSFLKKFSSLEGKRILVHGGGVLATQIGNKLEIKATLVDGRRITDRETIDLVTMVYGGLINKKLVASLQGMKCNAIGLTGADANILPAVKRPVTTIDYGFVGDIKVKDLSIEVLEGLLNAGLVPVMAPLTHDSKGQMLNTNADTIASALAVALSAKYSVRLLYCFEKKGVLLNVEDDDSVIELIDKNIYQTLLQEGKLTKGILPKIDNALDAVNAGVAEVIIGEADDLIANSGEEIKGTLVKK